MPLTMITACTPGFKKLTASLISKQITLVLMKKWEHFARMQMVAEKRGRGGVKKHKNLRILLFDRFDLIKTRYM